jgi:hypothetical protein
MGSVNNVNRFLNIEDSHLRVVSGNVYAQALNVGGITVGSAHGLQSVTNVSNTTNNTIEFTNTETSLVTSGDINMLHSSNNAAIKLNSNVVAEFPRSKKLIKYPRVALTGPSAPTGYVASASDESSGNSAWEAFDNDADGATATHRWRTNDNRYTDNSSTGTPSSPTGAASTYLFTGSEAGDWISVEFPEKMKLNYYTITGIHYHTPYEGVIYGYNTTTTTWERVSSFINRTVNDGTNNPVYSPEFQVDEGNTNYYSKYAMIVVKTNGHHAPSMYEWKLYGIPEYDPDADGVDVKVTSYPNVPNTDWLEVYYDAKDLVDGAVTSVDDLTPSGTNDGTATNVTVSDGAFVFNGTNSIISSSITQSAGAYAHTTSLWYYTNDDPATLGDYIYQLGSGGTNTSPSIQISSGKLYISFMSNYYEIPVSSAGIVSKQWVHIFYSYDGSATTSSSVSVYINGVKFSMTGPLGSSAGTALSLGANPQLRIGCNYNNGAVVDGKIANFRLFNRVLTSDEVWQLYAYQKGYFGHGDLSMTLKAGKLGIGTSEPRAALDVRGTIQFSLIMSHRFITGDTTVTALNYIPFSGIIYETPSGLHNDNYFTCPIKGVYQCIVNIMTDNAGDYDGNHTWLVNGSETSPTSRGYAFNSGGNIHKQATSHFYFELNAGDTVGVASAEGTKIWYGSTDHRHSVMSIRLITPT